MTTLLRLDAVKERTALSRSRIYELLERDQFPRPVKLSGRLNAWPDHEIDAWIMARIAEREGA
ncbi:helix-turn-helix transcriptional regulator [Altericroceibacterium xinjiangense]|uniref:helix-turn-helix transcriptional regulator n=1 Tax=Altericroceibacterium xinjiangense TaxID=762261 RepID=UPI000F7E08A3|nr:AlpA family phage regulatory protein [Altericroceibacterium xinjiangense]